MTIFFFTIKINKFEFFLNIDAMIIVLNMAESALVCPMMKELVFFCFLNERRFSMKNFHYRYIFAPDTGGNSFFFVKQAVLWPASTYPKLPQPYSPAWLPWIRYRCSKCSWVHRLCEWDIRRGHKSLLLCAAIAVSSNPVMLTRKSAAEVFRGANAWRHRRAVPPGIL